MYRTLKLKPTADAADVESTKLNKAYRALRNTPIATAPEADSNVTAKNIHQPGGLDFAYANHMMDCHRNGIKCDEMLSSINSVWIDSNPGEPWAICRSTIAKIVSGRLMMQTQHRFMFHQHSKYGFTGLDNMILRLCPHLVKHVWNTQLWKAGGAAFGDSFAELIDKLLNSASQPEAEARYTPGRCLQCATVYKVRSGVVALQDSDILEHRLSFVVWQDFGEFREPENPARHNSSAVPVHGSSLMLAPEIIERHFNARYAS